MSETTYQEHDIVIKHTETKAERNARIAKIKQIKRMCRDRLKQLKTKQSDTTKKEVIESKVKIKKYFQSEIDLLNIHVKYPLWLRIWHQFKNIFFNNPWKKLKNRFPSVAQFFTFFMLSNGITLLQMIIMPSIKRLFELSDLLYTSFQIGRIGTEISGEPYYMFNYPAGPISEGGSGGLGYFLAVQITLLIAQIINFFAQRNITFKSKRSPWQAATWYLMAYILITLIASALQGLYKAPIYNLFIHTLDLGAKGEVIADSITMVIYSAISFWVFYPIFKIIFKDPK